MAATPLSLPFEVVRGLLADEQDNSARWITTLVGTADMALPVTLTLAEEAAVAASKATAARGEFATEEQVRAVWAKHGL